MVDTQRNFNNAMIPFTICENLRGRVVRLIKSLV